MLVIAIASLGSPLAAAEASDRPTVGTPSARRAPTHEQLHRRLIRPISFSGPPQRLRDFTAEIATSQGLPPIWIDPRVDPNRIVTAPDGEVSLFDLLRLACRQANAQPSLWGAMVAVVPDDRIASLARREWDRREIDQAFASRRSPDGGGSGGNRDSGGGGTATIEWTAATTPNQLLDRLRTQWPDSIGVLPKTDLGHDVWRPGRWTAVDDLTALAAVAVPMGRGFVVEEDGTLRLTPLAPQYRSPTRLEPGTAQWAAAGRLFPDRRPTKSPFVFIGTASELDAIRLAALPQPPSAGERRFTLTLDSKIGSVLQMVDREGLPIRFTEQSLAAVDRDRRIQLSVRDADVDELAAAIADAAGLRLVPGPDDPAAAASAPK